MIYITGIQRSGTSIVARLAKQAGGYFGEVSSMMEHEQVATELDILYGFLGQDIRGQYPLPTLDELPKTYARDWVGELASKPNGILKSARIGQTYPIWEEAYPKAKWIIVRRKPSQIVESCMKTTYMNAFNDPEVLKKIGVSTPEEGWFWWIRWHEDRFRALVGSGVNYMEIWPERMMEGDYSQIVKMLGWLGLRWNDGIVPLAEKLLRK